MRLKRKIKVGIDSPSAAGAGTISKMLAKNYNLLYCDTGKIYRYMAKQIKDKKKTKKIKFLKKKYYLLQGLIQSIVLNG